MPEIYIYAELLLHIRQLTLHASLEEDKNQGSEVLVTSDKKIINVQYGDVTASIYLPTQIKGTANITFPTKRRTEFSTKLQIEDQSELQQAIDASPEIQVPWTAASLSPEAALLCKACHSTLLDVGSIHSWKDLPSENWAELMDLWFCHKPHEHHHDDSAAAESKGFSADSKVMNEQGTGLVDTLSFLLHAQDNGAVQRKQATDTDDKSHVDLDLICPDCESLVGTVNEAESSHRLWKSRIALKQGSDGSSQTYDSSIFIGAQMLQLIESNISRRVVLHCGEGAGILCWIFNPDVYYSSSRRGATVHRAMKVFYKIVDDPLKLLDENSTTLEELALPKTEFKALQQSLDEVKDILPASARTFQDWQVGLIDRYEATPSGLGAMDNNALNHPSPEHIELFKLPAGWASLYE